MDSDTFQTIVKFARLGLLETGYIITGEFLDTTNSTYNLIRVLYPRQIAEELCSVQSMSGSVGQIFNLRHGSNNIC